MRQTRLHRGIETLTSSAAPTLRSLYGRAEWLQEALVSGKYPCGTPEYNYIHLAVAELVDGLKANLEAPPAAERTAFAIGKEISRLLNIPNEDWDDVISEQWEMLGRITGTTEDEQALIRIGAEWEKSRDASEGTKSE